jgi:hypothetical protein
MNKKISDIMDCVEYYPLTVHERETQSTERIVDFTMNKINAEKTVEYNYITGRARRGFASVAIAAVLVVALAGAAFAAYHFGLKDLSGPSKQIDGEDVYTLSLNGLIGSPEYEAAQEWEIHLDKWYKEGNNLLTADNVPDESDMYAYNGAFSQEAKDTLDALLTKHHLKLHTSHTQISSADELYAGLGVRDFMPTSGDSGEYPVSGSYYEDGTFAFNSAALLSNGVHVRYQSYRFVKGAFTRVGYLLADASDFEEWTYTAANGIDMLLAISVNKSVIVVSLDDSFVFVNILSGTENSDSNRTSYGADPIAKSDLEALADSFNFGVLK